jgi:putative flippase GtrA
MTRWKIQGLRYGIVGIVSNLVLYMSYLLFTSLGVGHKTAMTVLYVVGVLQSFYFNKRWSFSHDGLASSALVRYLATYAFFYLLNIGSLFLFVDQLGLPHAWVQALTMLAIIVPLFLAQRYWVFPQTPQRMSVGEPT